MGAAKVRARARLKLVQVCDGENATRLDITEVNARRRILRKRILMDSTLPQQATEDDVLMMCVESSVESWVMDPGFPVHQFMPPRVLIHSVDGMQNVWKDSFGKVRIGNVKIRDVHG